MNVCTHSLCVSHTFQSLFPSLHKKIYLFLVVINHKLFLFPSNQFFRKIISRDYRSKKLIRLWLLNLQTIIPAHLAWHHPSLSSHLIEKQLSLNSHLIFQCQSSFVYNPISGVQRELPSTFLFFMHCQFLASHSTTPKGTKVRRQLINQELNYLNIWIRIMHGNYFKQSI